MAIRYLEQSLNLTQIPNIFREGRFLEITNDFRSPHSTQNLMQKIQQINYIVALPGEIGGNHYHNEKWEKIVILEGELLVVLEEPNSRERYEEVVSPGNIITLVPKIAHAFASASETNPVRYLEITNKTFNPEKPIDDVFKYQVLDLAHQKV